jgi:hypothetical protein
MKNVNTEFAAHDVHEVRQNLVFPAFLAIHDLMGPGAKM